MNRVALVERSTAETTIRVELNLDGDGECDISTGIGFFDHMLNHIGRHGGFGLTVHAKGDLHVDEHHTVEDVGICLGQAFARALGDKRGIERYGWAFVPMDEALARTIVDISGRASLEFFAPFTRQEINGFPLELVHEFFRALSAEARLTLHMSLLSGRNAHHQAEALFKSFGRAMRVAVRLTGSSRIPSTKGVL
jgi:imidazoleglycerol-phosphate dehydratase